MPGGTADSVAFESKGRIVKNGNRSGHVAVMCVLRSAPPMDSDVNRTTAIQRELDCAEAELAVIKQEHILRNLVTTGEPTAEAVKQLARLRDILKRIAAPSDAPPEA